MELVSSEKNGDLLRMATEPDLSFIRPDVSLDEMRALDRRRLLAIMNGLMMKMSEWLGEVAKKGEETLMKAERRLDKADAKLKLIETKLQGISLEEVPSESNKVEENKIETNKESNAEEKETIKEKAEEKKEEEKIELNEEPEGRKRLLLKDDPRYAKYFKMVKMGIQEEAVRLKMSSEGVDPSILDSPNSFSDAVVQEDDGISSDDSVGSFTDSE